MKPNNNRRWNRCIIDEGYCLTFGHGEQFFRAFDRAFHLQKQLSDSTSLPAVDVVGEVLPAMNGYPAGFSPASHASAPILNNILHPHFQCALAHPNEEPASDFAPGADLLITQYHYGHATASLPKWRVALHEVA